MFHFSDKNHLFCSQRKTNKKQYNNEQLYKVFGSHSGNTWCYPAYLQFLPGLEQLQRRPDRCLGYHGCRSAAAYLPGQEGITPSSRTKPKEMDHLNVAHLFFISQRRDFLGLVTVREALRPFTFSLRADDFSLRTGFLSLRLEGLDSLRPAPRRGLPSSLRKN